MIVVAITQARMTSNRLPGKILMEVEGKSLLEIHLRRVSKCAKLNDIVLATTNLETDNVTEQLGKNLGYKVFRGSESDVLDRFYKTVISLANKPDYVVRLTADCPLIDSELVDKIIEYTITKDLDYCSNCLEPKYPDGQDVEVFKFEALYKAWENAQLLSEREHVTPYIWKNSTFKGGNLFCSENFSESFDYSDFRITVDEPKDFELIKVLVENLGTEKSWREYTNFIIDNNLSEINKDFTRNEGLLKSLNND
jgi:spore coat polysaccharide biosynthesis protein SpsF